MALGLYLQENNALLFLAELGCQRFKGAVPKLCMQRLMVNSARRK